MSQYPTDRTDYSSVMATVVSLEGKRKPPSLEPLLALCADDMARVDREMDVINKLGFANYFLIVWDFVRFARSQDIPATARGSGSAAVSRPTVWPRPARPRIM